jgi:hypothetical protein
MPWVAAAVAAVGLAASIYGQVSEADAKADAERKDASLRELEAQETQRRAQINAGLIQRQGNQVLAEQTQGYAKSGVTGSGLHRLQARTELGYLQQIDLLKQEADYRAELIRQGAQVSLGLADSTETNAAISAFGTGIAGAGSILASTGFFNPKPTSPLTKTQSTPNAKPAGIQ